ncbi:hypothetical protein QJS04_geneDACA022674 [Acorus gramineus]|uniref:Uncharacterized protein n=1 Tax=Acorus gramineus TaxID=55184 RepID=A0AAV9BMU2_ACOGR|nr:hypothetical protein QJS04_geneDACA022674 [Acorus gramineus]
MVGRAWVIKDGPPLARGLHHHVMRSSQTALSYSRARHGRSGTVHPFTFGRRIGAATVRSSA